MEIRMLGTESLGVRGLSCVVEVGQRKIFIDPGISLGYTRYGLLPHPVQVGVGCMVRDAIIRELQSATDLVISHFHGDHVPLGDANPYQLSLGQLGEISVDGRIWAGDSDGMNPGMRHRKDAIASGLHRKILPARGRIDETLSFLGPVPHGEPGGPGGLVTMTRITDGMRVFLHASDIQCLAEETIEAILEQKPDTVLASGPPIYLADFMRGKTQDAWHNALALAKGVDTLVLDHHLLRCEKGLTWLDELASASGHEVLCAADFMGFERHLLEARRVEIYRDMPVPEGWHRRFAKHEAQPDEYVQAARKRYAWFQY